MSFERSQYGNHCPEPVLRVEPLMATVTVVRDPGRLPEPLCAGHQPLEVEVAQEGAGSVKKWWTYSCGLSL